MPSLTLNTELSEIFRLLPAQKQGLSRLGLVTVEDLLRYFPQRYIPTSSVFAIKNLQPKTQAVIEGKILKLEARRAFRKRLTMTEARISDDTGMLYAVWFHQPYIAKLLQEGSLVRLEGVVSERKGKLYISNPLFERIDTLSWKGSTPQGPLAVYPATKGISSRWIQFHIKRILSTLRQEDIHDPIPPEILERYHLPSLYDTLRASHFPKNEKETVAASKRLAFDEIFFIQLTRIKERMLLESQSSLAIPYDKKILLEYKNQLPFTLTKTQEKVLDSILTDISKKVPMARLLEGDVGSGKTAIAAAACYLALKAGFQATYMAPTEILAQQHFESFSKLIGNPYTKIALLTSSGARVFPSKAFTNQAAPISKSQMLKWIASGEVKIVIGTHALLSEKILFKNLAFIVVDEQHRFGINQRKKLAHSRSHTHSFVPHFLSMTATPIPRTLALTVFGDLDLSVLDELPPGRSPIQNTVLIKPKTRSFDHIRLQLSLGRQAYVICPRIDPGEDERKSVKKEFEHMKKELPEYSVGMLHGKMAPKEKEQTLLDFKNKKIDILIATSVVEVGIDVPNATLMIVEGADRFGLAQLHQLRGRIGRGKHQSFFYAVSDSSNPLTVKRLRALEKAKNGFELAEYDLQLRGPGELTGKNQWGLSDIGMEALKNIKMVEAARQEARRILEQDSELNTHPFLSAKLESLAQGAYHFE